jgi:hypothetical protein
MLDCGAIYYLLLKVKDTVNGLLDKVRGAWLNLIDGADSSITALFNGKNIHIVFVFRKSIF